MSRPSALRLRQTRGGRADKAVPGGPPAEGGPSPVRMRPSTSLPPGGPKYLCPVKDQETGPAPPSVLHPRL